jgi:hypothetical protein
MHAKLLGSPGTALTLKHAETAAAFVPFRLDIHPPFGLHE